MLDKEKRAPKYLIPSDMLDRVPLSALSLRDEVAVGARLESLEQNISKVSTVLEKFLASPPAAAAVTSRMNSLEESVMRISSLLEPGQVNMPSFRSLAGSGAAPAV